MAAITDMTLRLEPTSFFPIYNRGNGGIDIFFEEKNYNYFLQKYAAYMKDYWDTFAYCLLPNHFHILIQVKSKTNILEAGIQDFQNIDKKLFQKLFPHFNIKELSEDSAANDLLNFQNLVNLTSQDRTIVSSNIQQEDLHEQLALWAVSERFRRFILGYSKAINAQENRKGSLFQKLFKRKLVEGEENCKGLIAYIHRNPVHHNYCTQIADYTWSSYGSILSNQPTLLKRKMVLDWFGGDFEYINYHQQYVEEWKFLQYLIMED